MANRHKRLLRLVVGSLAHSTRWAYAQAWLEVLESGAQQRGTDEDWKKTKDAVEFILSLSEWGLSGVTIAGKLAGVALVGKMLWGYAPGAGELGRRLLEGRSLEMGNGGERGGLFMG